MSNIFYLKGSTPVELKNEIINWLNDQAITQRLQSRIAKLKRDKVKHDHKAETLEWVSVFLTNVVIDNGQIEVKSYDGFDYSKSVEDWLKEDKIINAIKKHRYQTGAGLKEAHDYCRGLRYEMNRKKD